MKRTISIALCTYNGDKFLCEQMDSLLIQDYKNIEIIVVDDASSDSTWEVIKKYTALDSRIKPYRNQKNIGFKKNFERALGFCNGDMIAPCDQDDIWSPNKLSELEKCVGDAMMIYCDSLLVGDDGSPLGKCISDKFAMKCLQDPTAFVFSNCVSGHAMLFRKELLSIALPVAQDEFHDWWLAFVAASNGSIGYCPKQLVRYRQHANAVTDISGLREAVHSKQADRKLKMLLDIDRRIKNFSSFSAGSEKEFFNDLSILWRTQWTQIVCWKLTLFLIRHRHRLFALTVDKRFRHLRRSLKYFFGIPVKRLIRYNQYRSI